MYGRCHFCKTNVRSGPRVEVRGGKVFGDVPGAYGKVSIAARALERVYHRKCYLAEKRRAALRQADPSAQPADVEEIGEGDGDS